MSLSWNEQAAQHLYRRAGFGGRPHEIAQAVQDGRRRAVERLLDWESIPTHELDARLDSYDYDFHTFQEESYYQFIDFQHWLYLRMIYSPRQLEEKLTLFWHMHFATSFDKTDGVPMLFRQNEIFRTMGAGRFGDLLLEVSRDPAMLIWLDNATNVKDAPNENFAREVMELFTMGINRYTQTDVTEAARAFTGWTIDFETYQFVNEPDYHDDGIKTVLGVTGALRGEDVIAILAARPETAEFVSTKLATYFLGVPPRRQLMRRLLDVWWATQGTIRALLREILLSDDFAEAQDRRGQVTMPVEYIVSVIRHLGIDIDLRYVLDYAYLAGQSLYQPPNVAGWKGGQHWINTGSYLARMNFAYDLTGARPGYEHPLEWEAAQFFANAQIGTADDLIDFTSSRLGMPRPAGDMREGLKMYLGAAGDPFAWNGDAMDRWGRGLLHLLLCSPQYQLQ